ncbi:ATP-binding cassette sub- B member 7, mitochondrial, partial [Perkinsus olseni]
LPGGQLSGDLLRGFQDPLCPDSLRGAEYDREYRRSPAVQPRYDTRRQTEESLRWPHAGRTYKDDVQQVRDSRARFIESRPDPWYARPRIGHRQMPKIRFEHDERRMVFVDDANQLVSMPFDLSVEDMYRDITKDSVKHMSREELRALRLRLQQERGRLDERLEECHNHHGDMVTRMFNLDYTPAVDPHPRLLWGLEAFDREASTAAAAAHPPLRSSDNRDLISFDRRSVTSSSDG